ncbi:nucleoside hydrolase [Falsirhodobacter deserti]|uniref:nucleoside hydrolase n=1 Tax=Falsirhodobacter deserti TaxID=1365611 RepID=UPI000FE2F09D|nr:nucleoside hydrolase [Falsirhodobacter deserti]
MTTQKIIIDAAPGQDDAIGLLVALGSSDELELLGVTVVECRVPLKAALHNTRRVCELAGRHDIGIFAGCDRPLIREPASLQRPGVDTGLDGFEAPCPDVPVQGLHAADFIIETLRNEEPSSVTLCCFGPLTNIATALQRAPDIAPRIREIVMMAGSRCATGILSPVAEQNAWIDPEALQLVLDSDVSCTLLPLDIAHQLVASPPRLAALRAIGTKPAKAAAAWADVLTRPYHETFGAEGMPLHSPPVIAYLLRPYLFMGRHVNVQIETRSELTRGMSVIDWWGITPRKPNALVMSHVEANGVFSLLNEMIAQL